MSVRLSDGATGFSPFSRSLASTNASTGLRIAEFGSRGSGTGGSRTGRNDQNSRSLAVIVNVAITVVTMSSRSR